RTVRTGLAWMNLANGEFQVTECAPEALEAELHRIAPAGLLYAESQRKKSESGMAVSTLPDWHFEADKARATLLAHFAVDTLVAFELGELPVATCAAGALLHYVGRTQSQALAHVQSIRADQASAY